MRGREQQGGLVSPERLKYHLRRLEEDKIVAKLYFHSEQALWPCIRDAIEKRKKHLEKENKGKISAADRKKIQYVEVDACSLNDMCWCCGDTLVSSCESYLDTKVVIRASGCQGYSDPYTRDGKSLRKHRHEFEGYSERKGYECDPSQDPAVYKPYIAHSVRL